MSKRIELAVDGNVEIFADDDTVPFLRQSTFPDGTPFESNEQALEWANYFVMCSENVTLKVPANKEELANPIIYTREELLSFGVPEENIPLD